MIYRVQLKIYSERDIPGIWKEVHVEAKTITQAAKKAEETETEILGVKVVSVLVAETEIVMIK